MSKWALRALLIILFIPVLVLVAAIAWPQKPQPAAMASINAPFSNVDFSTLPPVSRHKARDGQSIAYRHYAGTTPEAVALLLHGSSSNGKSMHATARALAARNIAVYAIDIRGHGQTGRRGDVDHISQPSEDVSDILALITSRHPGLPITLVGFSAGGGLALSAAGAGFAKGIAHLVLISPMLGPDQPPYTAKNPYRSKHKWAQVNLPRIIGLSILNSLGIHVLDGLDVIQFAVGDIKGLTPSYSHRLLMGMNAKDAGISLKAVKAPITLLAGEKDEVFAAYAFRDAVKPVRPDATVTVLLGLNHIDMILKPEAHAAIAAAIPRKPN